MRLRDKVAVITGAAAGIGESTARMFAREGAGVVVADWNLERASAIADEIGAKAIAVRTDVRSNVDAKAMITAAIEAFGRLDILVNNAGRGMIGTVETSEEEDWDDLVAVNLKSVYLCSKHAIPAMRAAGGGAIVNTASNVATMGIMNRAAYVAAKGGVASLTRAMALDHVADNIRVNAVAPGVVWSTYYEKMLASVDDPDAFKRRLSARAPMARMGTPDEIASAILWLASDEASFATGTIYTVDGGMTAWCGPT